MHNHEPEGYACPFCKSLREKPEQVIARTDGAAALLGLHRWGNSPVDVLIVPVEHIENLYDLPARLAPDLQQMTRAAALALKAVYHCEGISTRQHNEPAGNQDVWHYHVHVFPRFPGDGVYQSRPVLIPEGERLAELARLREYFDAHWSELISR